MFIGLSRENPAATTSHPNRFVPRLEAFEERLAPSTVHQIRSGSYGGGVVRYTFELPAGATIEANVRATNPGSPSEQQFDPIVGLFAPSGALLASDDDSGEGSNWAAKVIFTVQAAGTYTVGVTHFADFEVNGTPTEPDPHPGLDTGAFVLDVDVTTTRHWAVKDGTVHVPPSLESRIDRVADAYNQRTGRDLVITDGVRTAGEQAQAIYNKIHGDGAASVRGLYTNKALINEVIAAYRGASGQVERVEAMTETIQNQVDRGQFISKHLRSTGFDVRSRDMTAAQKSAFRSAVAAAGGTVIVEGGSQPHFHVQF